MGNAKSIPKGAPGSGKKGSSGRKGVIKRHRQVKGQGNSNVTFQLGGDDDLEEPSVTSHHLLEDFPTPGRGSYQRRKSTVSQSKKSMVTQMPSNFTPAPSKHTPSSPSSLTPSSLSTYTRNRFKVAATAVIASNRLLPPTPSPIQILTPTTAETEIPDSVYSYEEAEEDVPDVFKWSSGDAGSSTAGRSNAYQDECTSTSALAKDYNCPCQCQCPPNYYFGDSDKVVTPATTVNTKTESWKNNRPFGNTPRRGPFTKPPQLPKQQKKPNAKKTSPPSSTQPRSTASWPTPNGPRTPLTDQTASTNLKPHPPATRQQKPQKAVSEPFESKQEDTKQDKENVKTVARTGGGFRECCSPYASAPPVYISGSGGGGGGSYGSSSGCCGGGKTQNPLDRLRNVDVIESLSYYPPKNDVCCEPSDLYEICDECGEMEYIGEKAPEKSNSRKPVTYTRKQRFNFKHPDDDLPRIPAIPGEDGPPYVWPSVANPGYPPHRTCSFDEIPVGKNPGCKKKKKIFQGKSGLYVYDAKTRCLQRKEDVDETPMQIILDSGCPCPPDPCCVQVQEPRCPPPRPQPCQIDITPQDGQPPQIQMTTLENIHPCPPQAPLVPQAGPLQPQQLMQTMINEACQPLCPPPPGIMEVEEGLEANPGMAPICEMLCKMFMNCMNQNGNNNGNSGNNGSNNTVGSSLNGFGPNGNQNSNWNGCNNGFMGAMNGMPGYGMNYGNPCCNPCGYGGMMPQQCTMPLLVMPDHINNGQGMRRRHRRRYASIEREETQSYASYNSGSGSGTGSSSHTKSYSDTLSSNGQGVILGSDGQPCEDCDTQGQTEVDVDVRVSNGTGETTAGQGSGDNINS